jgi:UDP-N-acetylglucosamine 2-epimerase (non-hydrolysing)
MQTRPRVLIVVGTRPEAIKLAPVIRQSLAHNDRIQTVVCFTAQHREMLDQVANYFHITPDVDLNLMRPGQTLADLNARCLTALDGVISECRPDCVIAQGDTTTVFAAATAAFYRRVPFVHVEAGLRTGDVYAPWPEEFNRRVVSLVASVHCAPTARARENLLRECVAEQQIHVTGNSGVDALLWTAAQERLRDGLWQRKHAYLGDRRMVLVTGHRRENFGDGLRQICEAIAELSNRFPAVAFLYPVHPNPNVLEPVHRLLSNRPNVQLIEPAPYPEFVWLMDRASVIVTDSGGVQEEAPSLRKPVLVTRETTERPEAVDAGTAELVGADFDRIVQGVATLLEDRDAYARRSASQNPFGDGTASVRIVNLVLARAWEADGQFASLTCKESAPRTVRSAA